MKLITLQAIKKIIPKLDLLSVIEAGFVAYSQKRAVLPPVGEMIFENPPGEVHIKYGYIKQDKYYVVKIASGFYENAKINLPSSQGLMLLFNQNTGELLSLLLDEGYLTNIRTAVAGAIVANYLAPRSVTKIGIVGAGTQAQMQLRFLHDVVTCKEVLVWGREQKKLAAYKDALSDTQYVIQTTNSLQDIADQCNLIVTTTPAKLPLIPKNWLRPGTHITAIGSDTPEKQELDQHVFEVADLVVTDSIEQAQSRGEIYQALIRKTIAINQVTELGNVITNPSLRRQSQDQITIADLTGIAIQDLQIARVVYESYVMNFGSDGSC